MTPAILRRVAAAYGGSVRLGRALGVNDSTVRRWLSETSAIPDIDADMAAVLRQEAIELGYRAAECERLARDLERAGSAA